MTDDWDISERDPDGGGGEAEGTAPTGARVGGQGEPAGLLAVDLGLRMGLAFYDRSTARLCWYRSHHVRSYAAMKRRVYGLVRELHERSPIGLIVTEGDRRLDKLWFKEATRIGARHRWVQAHDWRPSLLTPTQRRDSKSAKAAADEMARQIIAATPELAGPTSLRHDAAEAILLGKWALELSVAERS